MTRPSADTTMITAKTRYTLSSKLKVVISVPRPSLAVTNSATRAPISARVSEVLRPAKMLGSAVGQASFQNTWPRVATSERISSSSFSSTDSRPTTVLITTGKNEMAIAITILDSMPKPNQVMKIGASTTLGITWKATTYGYAISLNSGRLTITMPSAIATTPPTTKPISVSAIVYQTCCGNQGAVNRITS